LLNYERIAYVSNSLQLVQGMDDSDNDMTVDSTHAAHEQLALIISQSSSHATSGSYVRMDGCVHVDCLHIPFASRSGIIHAVETQELKICRLGNSGS
jgi:hypothetical protein